MLHDCRFLARAQPHDWRNDDDGIAHAEVSSAFVKRREQILWAFGPALGHAGPVLGHLGLVLGLSWTILGLS